MFFQNNITSKTIVIVHTSLSNFAKAENTPKISLFQIIFSEICIICSFHNILSIPFLSPEHNSAFSISNALYHPFSAIITNHFNIRSVYKTLGAICECVLKVPTHVFNAFISSTKVFHFNAKRVHLNAKVTSSQ